MGCSESKKEGSAAPFSNSSNTEDRAKRTGPSANNVAETPERKAKAHQPSYDASKRVKTTRQKLMEEAENGDITKSPTPTKSGAKSRVISPTATPLDAGALRNSNYDHNDGMSRIGGIAGSNISAIKFS